MQSPLFDLIFASACTSTHHKLALDALRHLRGHDAARWRNLFLRQHAGYLAGSKAPDEEFKDFKNHVLHVGENYWGGAVKAALGWYRRTVEALRDSKWVEAVYAAGVLSHYYTDPLQPLHTAQSEDEGAVHRAAEWSIAQSYEELQRILEEDLGGYPRLEAPSGDDWLADMVRQGADLAHPHYRVIIDHYDLVKGVKHPPSGLDQEIKDRIARLIGHAAVGFARILERAFHEARVEPPETLVTLEWFLATTKVPMRLIMRKLNDRYEHQVVQAIFDEVLRTGKALKSLPEDDKAVRKLHAEEVLKVPLDELDAVKPGIVGCSHGLGAKPRFMGVDLYRPRRGPALQPPQVSSESGPARPAQPSGRSGSTSFQENDSAFQESNKVLQQSNDARKPLPAYEPRLDRRLDASPAPVPPLRATSRDSISRDAISRAPVSTQGSLSARDAATIRDPVATPREQSRPAEQKVDSIIANVESPSRSLRGEESRVRETPTAGEAQAPRESHAAREAQASDRKFHLQPENPVEAAPSIGPQTARRLEAIGVASVADLLASSPDSVAAKLKMRHIDVRTVRDWQAQAALVCRVPQLRGHDAQILVAAGVRDAERLAQMQPESLLAKAERVLATSDGQRMLRGGKRPDLAEVTEWIECSTHARPLRAAA